MISYFCCESGRGGSSDPSAPPPAFSLLHLWLYIHHQSGSWSVVAIMGHLSVVSLLVETYNCNVNEENKQVSENAAFIIMSSDLRPNSWQVVLSLKNCYFASTVQCH